VFDRILAATPGQRQHRGAEDQQHKPPTDVDVHRQGMLVHLRVRVGGEAEDHQHDAEEGEHETNWPANIETHKLLSFF